MLSIQLSLWKYGWDEINHSIRNCQEEYENSQEITKETTNKLMCNEIQFQDNRVSTAKIKSNNKNLKKSWLMQNCKK